MSAEGLSTDDHDQDLAGLPAGARVVVAMSGGVDSSAAAALLVERGFDVVGVTLKLTNAQGTAASIGGRCCSPRDIEDARATAGLLGIPHYVLDEVDAFKRQVIDDFVSSYRSGQTPNPCVRCNERVKFGPLVDFARAVGAVGLATGHYARLRRGPAGELALWRAHDAEKDQSYFLFGVATSVLAQVWFPLGSLDKAAVRACARRWGLPNADKPDSQEICFIPDGNHQRFLQERGAAGPAGQVLDEEGRGLGAHAGTHLFTIGQRKGVPARDGQRRFVVRIDAATGTVHTGPRSLVARSEISVADVRWVDEGVAAQEEFGAEVQIRHHARPAPARLRRAGPDQLVVRFDAPVDAPAPGQAAVFFAGARVLGGGWIA